MSIKTQRITCPFCGGDGRAVDAPCAVCHGDGQLEAIARDDAEKLRAFLATFDAWATAVDLDGAAAAVVAPRRCIKGLEMLAARASLVPPPPAPERCACGATWTPLHACHGARS